MFHCDYTRKLSLVVLASAGGCAYSQPAFERAVSMAEMGPDSARLNVRVLESDSLDCSGVL